MVQALDRAIEEMESGQCDDRHRQTCRGSEQRLPQSAGKNGGIDLLPADCKRWNTWIMPSTVPSRPSSGARLAITSSGRSRRRADSSSSLASCVTCSRTSPSPSLVLLRPRIAAVMTRASGVTCACNCASALSARPACQLAMAPATKSRCQMRISQNSQTLTMTSVSAATDSTSRISIAGPPSRKPSHKSVIATSRSLIFSPPAMAGNEYRIVIKCLLY